MLSFSIYNTHIHLTKYIIESRLIMKITYELTNQDIKEAAFEAPRVLPRFGRRRVVSSILYPLASALISYFFLPFINFQMAAIIFLTLVLIVYLHGYQYRLYNALIKILYAGLPREFSCTLNFENPTIIINQESVKREITQANIVASVEKEDNYILYLSEKVIDFLIIKKKPLHLSDEEIQLFNEHIKLFLKPSLSKKKLTDQK